MLPWARAYHEWLENRARQNFWRGSILFWVKLLLATPAQVLSKLAAYKKPPAPGSLIVTNDKEEWTQFAPNVGAQDAGEDGRQMRNMAAAGARIPSSWLSDGADANLATATAQALPAIRSFGETQDILAEQFWKPMLRRVIQNAIAAGGLPEMVEEQQSDGTPVEDRAEAPEAPPAPLAVGGNGNQPTAPAEPEPVKAKLLKAIEAFDITYPELEAGAPKDAVTAITMALTADLVSTETAMGLLPWPIDVAVEKRKIENERAKRMADMAAGLIPMPPQFGPNGQDEQDEEEDENGKEPEPVPGREREPAVPRAA
jgi:hypothetical protein